MNRAIFVIVLFCAQHAAVANASFWVSVGSFQDPAVAERVVGEASNALNTTFTVQRTETANGVVQRVATGPFDTRDDAQIALDHAKAGGYPDSWIFSRQTEGMTSGQAGGSADGSNVVQTDGMNGAGYQPPVTLQPQPTLQDALKQVKDLPTEIPPGYRLNQLYRDGRPPDKQQ
jgi:hypothetical protein